MTKAFQNTTEDDTKEARPEGVCTADEPLDITRTLEVQAMPLEANITPRGDSASEQKSNQWKSIGELARALADKAAGK